MEGVVRDSPAFARFLDDQGRALRHASGWSDYYAERPGGIDAGRTLYCAAFDLRELGEAQAWLAPGALFSAPHSVEVSRMAPGIRPFDAVRLAPRVRPRQFKARIGRARLAPRGRASSGRLLFRP